MRRVSGNDSPGRVVIETDSQLPFDDRKENQ